MNHKSQDKQTVCKTFKDPRTNWEAGLLAGNSCRVEDSPGSLSCTPGTGYPTVRKLLPKI